MGFALASKAIYGRRARGGATHRGKNAPNGGCLLRFRCGTLFFMAYFLKLRAIGSAIGVALPEEVLSLLQVEEGDTVTLVKDDAGFRIVASVSDAQRKIMAVDDISQRFHTTLRDLAA
jgi:putative addiction module antidote